MKELLQKHLVRGLRWSGLDGIVDPSAGSRGIVDPTERECGVVVGEGPKMAGT